MVSCIRGQQLTVNSISGKPQINNDKSVSKTHCSHSWNPDQDLIDAQWHINLKKGRRKKIDPIVFNSWWAKDTIKAYPVLTQDKRTRNRNEKPTATSQNKHFHKRTNHTQHSHWKTLGNKEQVSRGQHFFIQKSKLSVVLPQSKVMVVERWVQRSVLILQTRGEKNHQSTFSRV